MEIIDIRTHADDTNDVEEKLGHSQGRWTTRTVSFGRTVGWRVAEGTAVAKLVVSREGVADVVVGMGVLGKGEAPRRGADGEWTINAVIDVEDKIKNWSRGPT